MNNQLFFYLVLKNKNQGITLVEILVLITIIGILSAIAIPSFICRVPRAVLSEAKSYVTSMNRSQQSYFIESKDGKFSDSLSELNIGNVEQTENYIYYTQATPNAAFSYGIAKKDDVNDGWFNKKPVKSLVGGVFKIPAAKKSEIKTLSIVCINDKPGNIIPPQPILKNGVPTCAIGTNVK